MSLIQVTGLTFSYPTNHENIFENASFAIDTDWKLGFIGRNGRGKTTFLKLLCHEYEYTGSISASVHFDYFPFPVENTTLITRQIMKDAIGPFAKLEAEMQHFLTLGDSGDLAALHAYSECLEAYMAMDGYIIDELFEKELNKLQVTLDVLDRPFSTLSNGEQTKVLLAALFLKKNNFLLIDEPTNHLDVAARAVVSDYLNSKKGFILVSHDRKFLDHCVDHVLSINKQTIEVQKGNYSSWQTNKDYRDNFELSENEKLKKDVYRLSLAAARTAGWSDQIEASKIGSHAADRGAIGHKAAKMMKRAKSIENRRENALEDKKKLLKNLEEHDPLSLRVLEYPKENILTLIDLSVSYDHRVINEPVSFTLKQGDRIALCGDNGCGKSSILKLLLGDRITYEGYFKIPKDLSIAYISQDTSHLKGSLKEYALEQGIDESLFKTFLHKLAFKKEQFDKDMSSFSAGQKKKVLLSESLCKPAHLYIWDEPLNYIDVLSRIQIEELILAFKPTLLFVEHDQIFTERVATRQIHIVPYRVE